MTKIKGWRLARGHRDDGAAAVEFALVAPILLVLVFGIVAFGALFGQQLALNNGIRQGARLGIVPGTLSSCEEIIKGVQDASVPSLGLDGTQIKVWVAIVAPDGTVDDKCGTTENAPLTASGSSDQPCSLSLNPTTSTWSSLQLTSTYESTVLGPLPAFVPGVDDEFTLTSRGSFKCEFS